MNLADELNDVYSNWLLANYPEDIRNKDHHIELMCDGYKHEEFIVEIKKVLEK